jgi:O-antigen/teichoic acid export membrane protein
VRKPDYQPATAISKFAEMTYQNRFALSSVFKDAGWVLFGQVSGRGTTFLAGAGIAWALGTNAFADFSYLVLTSAALTTASSIGSGAAIIRYVAMRPSGVGNEGIPIVVAACLVGLLGGVALLLLVAALPSFFFPKAVEYLQTPILFTFGLQLVGGLTSSVLFGERKFASTAMANLASGFSLILLVAISILNKSRELAIWAIPLSQCVFFLLTARASAKFLSLEFRSTRLADAFAAMPSVMRFALPVFVISLLATTGPWAIGMLLLGTDKGEFAAYSAGLQWFSLILVVPGALTNAYLPRVFRNYAGVAIDAPRRPDATVTRNAKQALAIAAGGAALVLAFGDVLIQFHGQVLRAHRSVLTAFVLAAVVVAPTNALGNGLAARDWQVTWMALTGAWWAALLSVGYLYPVTTALSAGVDMCFAYSLLLLLALGATRLVSTQDLGRRSENTSVRIAE